MTQTLTQRYQNGEAKAYDSQAELETAARIFGPVAHLLQEGAKKPGERQAESNRNVR